MLQVQAGQPYYTFSNLACHTRLPYLQGADDVCKALLSYELIDQVMSLHTSFSTSYQMSDNRGCRAQSNLYHI